MPISTTTTMLSYSPGTDVFSWTVSSIVVLLNLSVAKNDLSTGSLVIAEKLKLVCRFISCLVTIFIQLYVVSSKLACNFLIG